MVNTKLNIDSTKLSIEEIKQAAEDLFAENVQNFKDIKNRKWYQSVINAVTFDRDGKKYILKDIRSLTQLQRLILDLYMEQFKDTNERLNDLIRTSIKQNEFLMRLYYSHMHIKPQFDPRSLSDFDKNILLQLLGDYSIDGDIPDELQKYNRNIAIYLDILMPDGNFKKENLSRITNPGMFYRCLMEQSAVVGVLENSNFPENILDNIYWLDLSDRNKEKIKIDVLRELKVFGREYFIMKYAGSIDYEEEKNRLIEELCEEKRDIYETEEIQERHQIPRENSKCRNYTWEAINISSKPVVDDHVDVWKEVSKECVKQFVLDRNERFSDYYVESAGYIIYAYGNIIVAINKETATKKFIRWEDSIDPLFSEKRIAAKNDILIWISDRILYYYDLVLDKKGAAFVFDAKADVNEITNIKISRNNVFFRYSRMISNTIHVLDLNSGSITKLDLIKEEVPGEFHSESKMAVGMEGYEYFVNQDRVYYIYKSLDTKRKKSGYEFELREYNLSSGFSATFGKPFFRANQDCELAFFGYSNNMAIIIIKKLGVVEGFYIDTSEKTNKYQNIFFPGNNIYFPKIHDDTLIYISTKKDFSLVIHNYINGKKRILTNKMGVDERDTMRWDLKIFASNLGDFFIKVKDFALVGKWVIWNKTSGEEGIIPIF